MRDEAYVVVISGGGGTILNGGVPATDTLIDMTMNDEEDTREFGQVTRGLF